ncbi:MAG: hypothetical protein JO053_08030 [Acidobacteria bacterium]|nr:hypothetical protein [Acidobacteriota bacterium]
MSKIIHRLALVLTVGTAILQFLTIAAGQDIEASISFDAAKPNLVHVEGKFIWPSGVKPSLNLSFVTEYAGIKGLGDRISNVELKAPDGKPVSYLTVRPGDYLASGDFVSWSYTMDLTPPKDPTAAAHVSWESQGRGILFLNDLLPEPDDRAGAIIHIAGEPLGTRRFGNKSTGVTGLRLELAVLDQRALYETSSKKSALTLSLSGEWKFSQTTAFSVGREILDSYETSFGKLSAGGTFVQIIPYPVDVSVGNYEADTRDSTITIISSDMPFESQSKQRLAEILRHEMFHLWFPNGVNLKGQYDWFYEGFAIYEAEKLGVSMGQIRFDDLLSTVERGLVIDRVQGRRQSLMDAGKDRFDGAGQYMYARGMLVAFLCDVAMLDASKGKQGIDDLLRDLYQKHRPPAPEADAEKTVLDALRSHKELQTIVDLYILGSGVIDPGPFMKASGLEWTTGTTWLKVSAKPSSRQKTILEKLGYNSWRKLLQK